MLNRNNSDRSALPCLTEQEIIMPAWLIHCSHCKRKTNPGNIVGLMDYLDDRGLFLCKHCGQNGNIEKKFTLQEKNLGQWTPYLKGVIRPAGLDVANTYQPFAFLVSYSPGAIPEDIWFCYYKDTRGERDEKGNETGRLKMGHGPGGPPVFSIKELLNLVEQLKQHGHINQT